MIYCVRLARGCAVCQERKHADNAAVLCYPEGRAYRAQHFRLAYDSGWLCRLWDNYVFSNLSCVVFCASHIMTAVSNTYTNIDTERYLYTSILCWLDGNTPKMTWIICDECVFEEISSQCVKRFKCVCLNHLLPSVVCADSMNHTYRGISVRAELGWGFPTRTLRLLWTVVETKCESGTFLSF